MGIALSNKPGHKYRLNRTETEVVMVDKSRGYLDPNHHAVSISTPMLMLIADEESEF